MGPVCHKPPIFAFPLTVGERSSEEPPWLILIARPSADIQHGIGEFDPVHHGNSHVHRLTAAASMGSLVMAIAWNQDFKSSAVILFSLPILVVLQTRDLWTITTSRWGQLDECRILIDQSAVLVYTSHAGQPAVFTWSGSQLHLYDENANPPITNRYLSGTLETVTENEVILRPIRLAGTIVQKKLDLLFNLYPGVNRTVLGIQTFLPLHCRMVAEDQRQLKIRGLIYEKSFGQSGYKSLTISGKLVVHQTQPFPTYFKERGGEINAAFPLDNMNFVVPTGKEIESILYSLSRTNYTAQLTETVKMATYGSRPNNDVLPIRIIVRLSRQELMYPFADPRVYWLDNFLDLPQDEMPC
ncbi:unnamed protein product [Calicophoron daubneyi]|uniref:Uncharacterized protein n=1 Tax=Calicophoron daubneyi TaxID=300641 RepID=A0AAV2TWN0_CALDB